LIVVLIQNITINHDLYREIPSPGLIQHIISSFKWAYNRVEIFFRNTLRVDDVHYILIRAKEMKSSTFAYRFLHQVPYQYLPHFPQVGSTTKMLSTCGEWGSLVFWYEVTPSRLSWKET
jgi:hypothetical protein